jgi:opacity protein-like surface antigen
MLAAAALLAAGAANAQIAATADLGTSGVGAHVVVPLAPSLNGRFGANYLHYNFNKTSNRIDYDLKGKLQTVDLLLDWYLREGSPFHLTGGIVYNGNKFDARGKPNGVDSFTLNGHRYAASDVGILTGRIDFRKAAPYLGLGWGNALGPSSRWNLNTDLGLFYQGSPNVELASRGCTASPAICDAIANDVAAERLHLRDDTDSFKIYPVLRVSLGYRF